MVTKIKMYVGECIGGEVGGFKHLHVETKQPNRASWTSPPVVRTVLNVKTELELFLFFKNYTKTFTS